MPTSATEKHLRTQLDELQRRYETITDRIAALDTDIGRELDSERKLVLQERRTDLITERNQVAADMERIDQQLAGFPTTRTSSTVQTSAQTAPAASLSPQERASLERQLAERGENLQLIEESKSQYVLESDIPLQLIKNERRLRERIAELETRLGSP